MNTFKKKSLYAALAGASALGVTGAAQAVSVNPDGLGQVLIYPYYTTQDKILGISPFSSLLSVVNSTTSTKAVKVRFNEGRMSREVLDFNLFLSPRDVWTAAVLAMPHAAGDRTYGAGVASFDKSCTVPQVSNNAAAPTAFVNYIYASDGTDPDLAGDGLDRTREGYVEIIEMGVVTDATVIKATTHVSGVPPCYGNNTAITPPNLLPGTPLGAPSGGLFGGMTIINVLAGEDYTEDAVALANYRTSGAYDDPGQVTPNLTLAQPPIAEVPNPAGGVVQSFAVNPIDAISALFMHDHVYNEFVLDTGTKSGTDWIVTMPTKRYYYTPVSGVAGISHAVTNLFQRNFGADGACDDISLLLIDREEFNVPAQVIFSPPKPGQKSNTLCWEANVITFNGTNVLGSSNSRNVATSFQNGWGDLAIAPVTVGSRTAHQLVLPSTKTALTGVTTTGQATYVGLPIIGFAVESFNNGTLTAPGLPGLIQSNYGGNFVHKTKRSILGLP